MAFDDYCTCINPSSIRTELDDLNERCVCNDCNKEIDPLRKDLNLCINEDHPY